MIALQSTREAARTLKHSVRTLERWRVSGGGPQFVKAGRRVLAAHVVPNTSAGRARHG